MDSLNSRDSGGRIYRPVSRMCGFSLVELLIVIVIIGILAGIGVPMYLGQRTKAMQTEATANLQALRLLLEQRYAENGCYYTEGTPPACRNKTFSNVSDIKTYYPNFRPGDDASLKFKYELNVCPGGGSDASAFTAYATGKTGEVVKDVKFWIDQNNVWNAAAPPCP